MSVFPLKAEFRDGNGVTLGLTAFQLQSGNRKSEMGESRKAFDELHCMLSLANTSQKK